MNTYMTQIAWLLGTAFVLSLLYELYRATFKTGISEWDSMKSFLRQQPPILHYWLCNDCTCRCRLLMGGVACIEPEHPGHSGRHTLLLPKDFDGPESWTH